MTRTVAYVCDVILPRTGEVITRESQKKLIDRFAVSRGIEIAEWFEDEAAEESVLSRPGVQRMISGTEAFDLVLVERIWSLSRNMAALDGLFAALDEKRARLESTSTLWDLTSQKCRMRVRAALRPGERVLPGIVRPEAQAVRIRKPEKLNFVVLQPGLVKA